MDARHKESCQDKNVFTYFLVCKGLSNDDVGAARGSVFQEIRPGAGFKTVGFVEEKLGGLPWNDSLAFGNSVHMSHPKRDHEQTRKYAPMKPTIQFDMYLTVNIAKQERWFKEFGCCSFV